MEVRVKFFTTCRRPEQTSQVIYLSTSIYFLIWKCYYVCWKGLFNVPTLNSCCLSRSFVSDNSSKRSWSQLIMQSIRYIAIVTLFYQHFLLNNFYILTTHFHCPPYHSITITFSLLTRRHPLVCKGRSFWKCAVDLEFSRKPKTQSSSAT